MTPPELLEFDPSEVHAAAFCPTCGAGYTAGRERCADCGQELLSRSEVLDQLPDAPPELPDGD